MKKKIQLIMEVRSYFSNINKLFLISILVSFLISGCQKAIFVPAVRKNDLEVNQKAATVTQPAKYFICGNSTYPCKPVTYKWQRTAAHHTTSHKAVSHKHSKLMINKPKEQQYEAPTTVKSCKINPS